MEEEKSTTAPEGLDAEKIVECLRRCSDMSFEDCKSCHYRGRCDQLILDTIALLETGYDLKGERHEQ